MAVKRPKRSFRLETVKQLYAMVKGGYTSEDAAKAQFAYSNVVVFKTELEKFAQDNPDINMEDFANFLINTESLQVAGKKATSGGRVSSLASDEKIVALGILPENVEAYQSALAQLAEAKAKINELIVTKEFSCGYYITKHGKKAQ